MDTKSFYGNPGPSSRKRTRRFVTLGETQEEVESRNVQNVVVLPPSSGDQNKDSDIEEKDDIVCSDDEAFEPAGELEVEESESDSDEEVPQQAGRSSRNQCATSSSGWKKKTFPTKCRKH